MLSIDVRVHQPLVDETCTDRVFIAYHASKFAPVVATRPLADIPGLQQDEEVDRVCLENVEACAEVQKTVLPEMLRLEASIEK